MFIRSENRSELTMRTVSFQRGVQKYSLGSCLVSYGDTQVLCSANIEDKVPNWLRGQGKGWINAEYSMLPGSTHKRTKRETQGQKGRSHEIQRLIGRSLRTVCDLQAMGEIQITIDCDVLQADGSTRCASITGAWVALFDAFDTWLEAGRIPRIPLKDQVVALSSGLVDGHVLVDLDYAEDSTAELDMNIVMTSAQEFIELQGTGERLPFSRERLNKILDVTTPQLQNLLELQACCVGWK